MGWPMPNKPVPTALKLLRGNPGKRALPASEPQLPIAVPTVPPPELTGIALAEWQRLEPVLRCARVLTEGDRTALVAACQQWARYLEAEARVRTDGLLIHPTPRSKAWIHNPYLAISNKALALCVKLWTELGLTPSARTRVVSAQAAGATELETFLQS